MTLCVSKVEALSKGRAEGWELQRLKKDWLLPSWWVPKTGKRNKGRTHHGAVVPSEPGALGDLRGGPAA